MKMTNDTLYLTEIFENNDLVCLRCLYLTILIGQKMGKITNFCA